MKSALLALHDANRYCQKAQQDIQATTNKADLLQVQSHVLGKKSPLHQTIAAIAGLPTAEEKKQQGAVWHAIKQQLQEACKQQQEVLAQAEIRQKLLQNAIDYSLPVDQARGGLHPVTHTKRRIETLFTRAGFKVASGPEIESEHYNFTALNIPANHPARASHDTFYFDAKRLLRTHTSPVQVRTLEAQKPPVYIICPGRVYRFDSDATHTPMFHQVEGLIVDTLGTVSFAHLKGLLTDFLQAFFGKKLPVRFRPSYFPFTEPSVEVDIGCVFCQKGCRVCSYSGWIEVLGAGMVHPNVLSGVGIDYTKYQGLAFGMGVERFCMLYYAIDDLRLLYENDIRMLMQFQTD